MKNFLLKILFISAILSSLTAGYSQFQNDSDSSTIIEGKLSLLAGLIFERLSLSVDVAAWKFINEVPIENKEREEEVIRYQVQSAIQMNMDTNQVKKFYQNQIMASKLVQNYLINYVFRDSAVTEANDLEFVTRPAINHTSNYMLIVLRDVTDYLQQEKWKEFFLNEIKTRGNNLHIQNPQVKKSLLMLLTDII